MGVGDVLDPADLADLGVPTPIANFVDRGLGLGRFRFGDRRAMPNVFVTKGSQPQPRTWCDAGCSGVLRAATLAAAHNTRRAIASASAAAALVEDPEDNEESGGNALANVSFADAGSADQASAIAHDQDGSRPSCANRYSGPEVEGNKPVSRRSAMELPTAPEM